MNISSNGSFPPVPHHPSIMPWSQDGESDRRYRRALLIAMLLSLLLRASHPPGDRAGADPSGRVEIPERLAMLVRKEHKKPEPVKTKEEKKEVKKSRQGPGEAVAGTAQSSHGRTDGRTQKSRKHRGPGV